MTYAIYPLPPLEEQSRIVTKVNDLLALCDKLEAKQQIRDKLCKLTRVVTLTALANASSKEEIRKAWTRVEANTPLFLDSPESIQDYKGAILDLAMTGALLNPESGSSSTGSELLKKISSRREAWVGEAEGQELKEALAMLKKVRMQRVAPPKTSLPPHWTWSTFLQISQTVVDCHNKTAPYVADGIHLVRTTDIRNGQMDLRSTKKITQATYEYWARRLHPKAGDLFFTREAPMGEAAIVPDNEKVCLGQRTMLVRLFSDLFNNRFLLYAIYSPSFKARMLEASIGATVKHLRVGGVEDLFLPVPPKEEQDQIVHMIDALFYYCDRLTVQLSRKNQKASTLAKSIAEAITGIQSEDKEKMKAPKTELVSNLRIGLNPTTKDQAPLSAILLKHKGELSAKALWQYSGLEEIDAFYRQLKLEMAKGWIVQPDTAYMRELEVS